MPNAHADPYTRLSTCTLTLPHPSHACAPTYLLAARPHFTVHNPTNPCAHRPMRTRTHSHDPRRLAMHPYLPALWLHLLTRLIFTPVLTRRTRQRDGCGDAHQSARASPSHRRGCCRSFEIAVGVADERRPLCPPRFLEEERCPTRTRPRPGPPSERPPRSLHVLVIGHATRDPRCSHDMNSHGHQAVSEALLGVDRTGSRRSCTSW